ncbi:hypothetical protein [[Eubacterium] cellulosolvens]
MNKSVKGKKNHYERKAVCLISTGIDSPVAAYMTLRSGIAPVFLHFIHDSKTEKNQIDRIVRIVQRVKAVAPEKSFLTYVAPQKEILLDVTTKCPRKLTCIICRRMMFRIASEIAQRESATWIVTGEILATHASQTLNNIYVENQVISNAPILRPLIGLNKLDVEKIARKIGTYEIAAEPSSTCPAVPRSPRTGAVSSEIIEAEALLNIQKIVGHVLAQIRKIHL